MRPALLVQDIQNVWLYEPDSNQKLRESVEKRLNTVNEAIAWFRRHKFPVIVGYTVDTDSGLLPGTKSYSVPRSVKVKKTDFSVTKSNANAFANPRLAAYMRRKKCDSICIVGLSASGCVLATFFSAPDSGMKPFLIKGGVASSDERHVRFAEEICDTLTLKQLDELTR